MIDPNTEDQAVSAAPPLIQPVAVDYKLDASAKSMSLQAPAPTPEPFEPPSQMAEALRKSAEGMFNQSRQELNSSIFQATSKNPDEEAAAQKLGAATGVGSGIALRNKDELERRKAMNDARNLDLIKNNPLLADKLIADPQFAAVAHDDLSWWDKYGKLAHSVLFPASNPAWFAESVMQTSMGKAFAGGVQVPQITELQREQALSPNGILPPEREQQLQALEAQQAQTQQETGGMLNTPASMAGNIVGMGESLAKFTTAGATIGGTAGLLGGPFAEVTVPGGIIVGGTSGFSTGMATEFSKQAMYSNYRQSRLQGISHKQALSNAHIVGIANAVFNAGALKLVGAPIGDAISSLAAPVTESVVVPTAKAIVIDYLKAYGLHEVGAFGLGAGLKASEIGAAKISGIKTTEGAMNIAEEILTSGAHTAYDFALLNALFPLLPAAAQYRVLKDSEMRQAKFKAKIKFVAENNKTKKRSTEQMQNGIESVTPESEQFIYVDKDQLNNVLMQSGASAKEIEQILPGVLAQLEAENPEIAINSANYLANEVASTNIGKALEPNLRMEKGGLSPNEILQQNIDASRVRAEAKAAVEQYAKMNAGFVESAQKVEDLYFKQLVAAGYKEQEARFHAAMIRDYYAVIAAREKKTPEQVQAERPYTIVSEQQAREQQAAQQAQQAPAQVSFEQASIDNVSTVTETMNSIRSKAIENAMATGVSKTKAAKAGQEAVQAWINSNQNAYAKYKLDKDYQESAALQKATAETTAKIDALLSEANDALINAGFVLERDQEGTSKSRYYQKGNLRVRVSDHEIPLTPERQYNRKTMGEPWKDFVVAKENKRGISVQEEKIAELKKWIAKQKSQGSFEQASRADLGLSKPVGKQVVNIETNEFKDWFAGSVATVTKDGYPIKLYRWARSPFVSPELDSVAGLAGAGSLLYGDGVTLTTEPMAALEFKGNPQDGSLLEVVTRMKNPLVIDAKGDSGFGIDAFNEAVAKLANISVTELEAMPGENLENLNKYNEFVTNIIRNAGHDGVHVKNAMQSDSGVMVDSWVPFNTEDIMTINVATAQDAWNFEDATPDQQDPNILRQEAILEQQPGANSPGVGVEEKPKLGFWKPFRVKVTSDVEIPKKPLILTGTKNSNAQKQLVNIDGILEKFPNAGESVDEWTNMMAYALGSDEVPIPPYAFIKGINGNGSFETLSKLTAGQIADASYGFENAKEIREAYTSGQLDVTFTAKLILWSFLSRGVSPYTQESLFIDAFNGSAKWIDKASRGEFTEADFPAYEEWAKSVAPKGSGQPGAGATHNLNAFGQDFLFKMSRIGENGKSHLQNLHEMFSDPNQTGKKIRREFSKFGEGVGIDNKVISFTLLVAGFSDVMILDRVQIRQLWDDGRFQGVNLYDGSKNEEGNKISGSSMNDITEGVRGILVYEALERQLEKRIGALYEKLGRPEDASTGRYHWETWVAFSEQEASHGTLMAILKDAKGDDQAISNVASKQGEYGTYEYGTLYNRDKNGTPWFKYETPSGNSYSFSVLAFREFLANIKQPKNGVVPTKFKVTESGNAPWYTRPEVNKQQLDTQAAKWADLAGGTGEGKRITDETIQRDIANRARSSADAESIAKSWEIPTKPAGLGTIQSKLFAGGEATKFARSNRESNGTHFSYERSPVGNVEGSRLLGVPTVGAFTAGSGLAELYKKSGNATPTFYELKSSVAGAERFHSAISDNKSASKFGAAVAVYSVEDYKGMRLFLSEDGNSGVAIKPDGDIVSVFSSGGAGRSLMELAVSAGGKKLDAFDTVLPHFYAPHGFVVASRMDWNEEFKPEGWNKETFSEFNGGSPDVVFMSRDDSFTGKYNPTDGTKFEDYDKAVEKQQELINVINKPLFQAAKGPPAGTYDPAKILTTIMKSGNKSTLIHETAHFFLHMAMDTASKEGSSLEAKQDAQVLLDWFGVKDIAAWNSMTLEEQRQHHEAFALNWEIYVHEGKAPSIGLQKVFDAFSRYLKRVYVSIVTELNEVHRNNFGVDLPSLTPEVKGVMDRMLANDAQISQREAIDNIKAQWETQEESGMNDGEWAALKEMEREAHDQAESDLNKASLKQVEWLTKATERLNTQAMMEFKRLRKTVSAEETAKMEKEPLRQAENFLKTGKMLDADGNEIEVAEGFKLDKSAVGAMYPTSTTGLAPAVDLSKLKGMTMDGGLAPDLVAEMFGLSSGDELIRKLVDQKSFKDELQERTDAKMEDEHGDLNTEEARQDAVNQALHNELRARYIAVQNRFRNKIKTPVAQLMIAVKERSQEILAKMKLKDIRPTEFSSAEAREAKTQQDAHKAMQTPEKASKTAYTRSYNEQIAAGVEEAVAVAAALEKGKAAAEKAQAKIDAHKEKYGDVMPEMVARKAGDLQELYNRLAKDAFDIKDSISRFVKYTKNVLSDDNRKRMGADHADQIEAILERFGLMGRYVAPTTRTPLATWAQVQQDIGFDIEIPDIVQESVRKNFLELTPEEFQDVIDTVKQIAHTGKTQQLVLTMDRKVTFEKAKTEIVDSINANAGGRKAKTRTATTNVGRSIETLTGFFAAHLKAAIVAQIMDGGKDGGPLWNYLIRSANTAGNKETTMRAAATKRISEILDPVFKGGKMGGAGVYFPSVDRSFNRESVLTIALNMGNESNMQRLLDGEGWTLEQVMPIIQSLTAAELNAVQEVWDYSETFKAEIIEKSRRTVGREPNWIEPKPLQVMSADGQMVSLKGGYYPVKYDPRASARSQSLSAAEQALRDLKDAYIAATTRRSYTKSRVKEVYDRPLLLNLSGLYSGIGEVIHDLSWHEWLIDSNRLMRSSAFDKAVREQYGVEFKDQITSWIKDVAAGDKGANNAGEMALNYLRQGVSAAGLGFNLMSAVGQITGFAQSVVKVGAKWIGRGIAVSASNPSAAIERVYGLSSFMANRGSTQFRELNEIKNMVRGENVAMKRVKTGTYFLMMQMQRMVDIPTWIGAYEKQLSINSDEKLAIAIADQAVIDSQGGGMLKDLSAIERGGPIQKLFTVFYSFMNTNLNLAVLKGMTEKNAGKYVAQQTMLWVVPVVTMYMLKKLLTPQAGDDDDKFDLKEMAKELAAEELSFLMGSFMVVREFADAAKIVTGAKTYGTDYRGPAGLRMIGDTYKFANQAAQLEFDTAFRKAAINIIGSSTGLPAAQINRTIDGIEALLEGETENITAPLFGVKKR